MFEGGFDSAAINEGAGLGSRGITGGKPLNRKGGGKGGGSVELTVDPSPPPTFAGSMPLGSVGMGGQILPPGSLDVTPSPDDAARGRNADL